MPRAYLAAVANPAASFLNQNSRTGSMNGTQSNATEPHPSRCGGYGRSSVLVPVRRGQN